MTHVLSAFARPTPCCARITPTPTGGWRAALGRLADALRDAWRTAAPRLQEQERLAELDAAAMRDLGLSHAAASWTPRGRIAKPSR